MVGRFRGARPTRHLWIGIGLVVALMVVAVALAVLLQPHLLLDGGPSS